MADLEALLAPVSEAEPAGADLSDDDRRQKLDLVFETSASGEESGGDEVDWRSVVRTIEEQSALTKDIWLPVYMARAGARAGDLETVELGCRYLAGMCETYWDSMYPALDVLGFQGRRSPCESLTSIGRFIRPLRQLALVEHPRHGNFNGEDIEQFAREGELAAGYGMFRAALDETPPEQVAETVERLDRIREAIGRVDAVLTEHANGDTGVNFSTTYATVDSLRSGLAGFAGLATVAEPAAEGQSELPSASPTPGAGVGMPGRIDSREDVIRALDAAIDYYRRREPASPVPVALHRAKAWVGMDFLAILEDIAPDSLNEARRVLTSQRNESG